MTDKLKKKYGWTHVLMSYTKTSGCWRKKKRKSNHLHHLPRLRRRRHCRCQHVHHRPHHKDILSSSSCLQFLSIISSQLPPAVRPGKSCNNLSECPNQPTPFSLSLSLFLPRRIYIYSYVLYIHSCTQTFSSTLSLFPFDFLFAFLSFFIFILYHSIAM